MTSVIFELIKGEKVYVKDLETIETVRSSNACDLHFLNYDLIALYSPIEERQSTDHSPGTVECVCTRRFP